jgi:dihydroorotase
MSEQLQVGVASDFHVHLRQGEMLASVAPLVRGGGVGRCMVMPNTRPPVVTADDVARYRAELTPHLPGVDLLFSLYLDRRMSAEGLAAASAAGAVAVKCYPRGVTTNSAGGVEDLAAYADLFGVMQELGMVLQFHGEMPSSAGPEICIMNAEQRFLPQLERIHAQFPKLKIILEHVTTRAAVSCVQGLGESVAATITVHHLDLTVDDWAINHHNYCKPPAKLPDDREALREVVRSGDPRFFFGSDSAPHAVSAKQTRGAAAGVFTTPYVLAYLADAFERFGCLDRLGAFVSSHGCAFYGVDPLPGEVTLLRESWQVPDEVAGVVPFRAGDTLAWRVARQ